jgi:glycosyltransferase involved in cell wall biosynthesis
LNILQREHAKYEKGKDTEKMGSKAMKSKILIVSQYFSPTIGGTCTVLKNLLEDIPKDQYTVISCDDGALEQEERLDCSLQRIKIKRRLRIFEVDYFLAIPKLLITAKKIIKRDNIGPVLGVFPSTSFFIGSYLISRLFNKPLYIYLMDTFYESRRFFLEKIFAKLFQKRIFLNADKVLVLTEGIQHYYANKYRINPILIPHVVRATNNSEDTYFLKSSNSTRIVFTGQIHSICLDAILNLIKAINLIQQSDVELTIVTNANRDWLERVGIKGEKINILFLKKKEDVLRLQRQADILFLPIAFDPPYPIQALTCFPTKTVEYLVSKRPILIHAPSHYYFCDYLRKYQFGLLVDKLDPQKLKEAIIKLSTNFELQKYLVENADKAARNYHNKEKIVGEFERIIFSI